MGSYATDDDRQAFLTADSDTSEAEAETPEAPPEEEDTPDEGEPGTGEPEEGDEEPAAEQPESHTFTVKIDGQDREVSEEELVAGYLRQSDYTRKSQQVANDRRRLADAELVMQKLDENPQATLAVLARHYGVAWYDSDGEPVEAPPGPTPEQVQLNELTQWQAAEMQRQSHAAVDAEIDRLHREYGEFDDDTLFGFAVEQGIRDLETALRAMTYGRPAPTKQVEKRKVAAMAGGSGSNGVAKAKVPVEEINSFRDAYNAAKRERGDRD